MLLYSAQEQPRVAGQIPYAMSELCRPIKFGNSDDLDVWLLLAASEDGLATRDLRVFNTPVSFSDGGRATLWVTSSSPSATKSRCTARTAAIWR